MKKMVLDLFSVLSAQRTIFFAELNVSPFANQTADTGLHT